MRIGLASARVLFVALASTASADVADNGVLGPPAAFPGCEGMGCAATGGRGGDVYTVNTLADGTNAGCVPQNGPQGPTCSLRDVLTKTGPRTCVFSIGGTITVTSALWSVPGNLTIAGQTAPGGGIQLRGDGTFGPWLRLGSSNEIDVIRLVAPR